MPVVEDAQAKNPVRTALKRRLKKPKGAPAATPTQSVDGPNPVKEPSEKREDQNTETIAVAIEVPAFDDRQVETLKIELNSSRSRIQELETYVDDLVREVSSLNRNNALLSVEVETMRESRGDLEAENEELLRDMDGMVEENEELRRGNGELRAKLEETYEEKKALVEERDRLEHVVGTTQDRCTQSHELKKYVSYLRSKFGKRLNELTSERDNLEAMTRRLSQECDDNRQTLDLVASSKNEIIRGLEEQLRQRDSAIEKLGRRMNLRSEEAEGSSSVVVESQSLGNKATKGSEVRRRGLNPFRRGKPIK